MFNDDLSPEQANELDKLLLESEMHDICYKWWADKCNKTYQDFVKISKLKQTPANKRKLKAIKQQAKYLQMKSFVEIRILKDHTRRFNEFERKIEDGF